MLWKNTYYNCKF